MNRQDRNAFEAANKALDAVIESIRKMDIELHPGVYVSGCCRDALLVYRSDVVCSACGLVLFPVRLDPLTLDLRGVERFPRELKTAS